MFIDDGIPSHPRTVQQHRALSLHSIRIQCLAATSRILSATASALLYFPLRGTNNLLRFQIAKVRVKPNAENDTRAKRRRIQIRCALSNCKVDKNRNAMTTNKFKTVNEVPRAGSAPTVISPCACKSDMRLRRSRPTSIGDAANLVATVEIARSKPDERLSRSNSAPIASSA